MLLPIAINRSRSSITRVASTINVIVENHMNIDYFLLRCANRSGRQYERITSCKLALFATSCGIALEFAEKPGNLGFFVSVAQVVGCQVLCSLARGELLIT